MKKLIAILLFIGLLLMTACQAKETNISVAHSQTENTQLTENNNFSNEEKPTKVESEKDTEKESVLSSKLSVPIHIVRQEDNKKAYRSVKNKQDIKNDILSTEKEIGIYADWMNKLDCKDITAIYGACEPTFEYTEGDMKLEDSQIIFDKLKAVTSHLKPMTMEERRNPWMGNGGWILAIHQGEDITTFSFNGGWFVFGFSGESNYWVFNIDETPAQKICNEINDILGNNMNNGKIEEPTLFYQGSELEHLYAIDTENYVMAEIMQHSQIKKIIDDFEGRSKEQINLNGYGYLLFNGDGKQYHYLNDNDRDISLTKNCIVSLTNTKLYPSWLIHMTPKRIVSANIETDLDAYRNPDNAVSQKEYSLTVTDNKESLLALSKFLKEEVTVGNETGTMKGMLNPIEGSIASLDILFDSNVHYIIDVRPNTMYLYSSDLDTNIKYTLNSGVAEKINDFLRLHG